MKPVWAALKKLLPAFWASKHPGTNPQNFEASVLRDDLNIQNTVRLLRRINPDTHLVVDESGKGRRLSSGAFSDSKKGNRALSVSIEKFLQSPQDTLKKYPGNFLVAFDAGFVRNLTPKQGIAHTPTEEDHSHGCCGSAIFGHFPTDT